MHVELILRVVTLHASMPSLRAYEKPSWLCLGFSSGTEKNIYIYIEAEVVASSKRPSLSPLVLNVLAPKRPVTRISVRRRGKYRPRKRS